MTTGQDPQLVACAHSDGNIRVWTNNFPATPAWTIPFTPNLGAPPSLRLLGDLLAVNSVDNTLKVFRLRANGNYEKMNEMAGEVA